jgi:eukaryotic-like serine/threonine-protein kinase
MPGLTNPPDEDVPPPESAADEEATRLFTPLPTAVAAGEPSDAASSSTTGSSAAKPAAVAPSLASIAPGALLGHTYEIENLLARGGMGEVYRARHTELGSLHAIKVILPQLASEARFISLFQEEARKLRRVRDDAVVGYEGLFLDENGLRYLVMEFVDGPSLAQVIAERPLDPTALLQLRDRVARGLAAAHEKGIYHRDISPDNIILVENRADQAKIIDFGIAKSTEPGDRTVVGQDFAGKYSYVSPEQLGLYGGAVDGRSDIYSLGLVLAAAVIGRPLPMGNSPISVIEARQRVPDLSAVPVELRGAIAPLLEPNPDDRPQSMRELIGSVTGPARTAVPIIEPVPPPDFDLTPPAPVGPPAIAAASAAQAAAAPARRGFATTLAAVAVLSFAAAAGTGWYFLRSAPQTELAGTTKPTPPQREVATPQPATTQPATTQQPTPQPQPAAAQQPTPPPAAIRQPAPPQRADLLAAAQRIVDGFQCARLSVSLGEDLRGTVTGFVGGQMDLSSLRASLVGLRGASIATDGVKVYERPYCNIVQLLQTGAAAAAPPVEFNRSSKVYHNGDKLVLTARSDRDGYLYVDYIDNTGSVVHMLPAPGKSANFVKSGKSVTLGSASATPKSNEQIYEVSEPFGANMIVTILSPKPLFDRPRPEQEPFDKYGDALAAALHNAGPEVSSSFSFFDTLP